MTSFDPTSRCEILPSGDTRDLVSPGISRVVGLVREAVVEPESRRPGGLVRWSVLHLVVGTGCKGFGEQMTCTIVTYILGLLGAVVAGVSVSAAPAPAR